MIMRKFGSGIVPSAEAGLLLVTVFDPMVLLIKGGLQLRFQDHNLIFP